MKKLILFQLILLLLLLGSNRSLAQLLKPGFDKIEYEELLKIFVTQVNIPGYKTQLTEPKFSKLIYRSPNIALDNSWDLWLRNDGIAIISIRSTTIHTDSWLENFYAAMLPATGTIHLKDSTFFNYKLAQNPRAAVHAGWLNGLAYLASDILQKMDSCISNHTTQFIIAGHSQGAAISILLTAHLNFLIAQNRFALPITLKTYSSASPKPGNLYFAYDYDSRTVGAWSLTVINSADWVSETPVTIQTLQDFNQTNPFNQLEPIIKKQHFPKNLAMRFAFYKLSKPLNKAQKNHQKYLGNMIYKIVNQKLKNRSQPAFANTQNYTRCGQQVILLADDLYFKQFPDDPKSIFRHHAFEPYLFLLNQFPDNK